MVSFWNLVRDICHLIIFKTLKINRGQLSIHVVKKENQGQGHYHICWVPKIRTFSIFWTNALSKSCCLSFLAAFFTEFLIRIYKFIWNFRWRSEIRMKPNEAADHEWIRQRKARQKNSTKDKKGNFNMIQIMAIYGKLRELGY